MRTNTFARMALLAASFFLAANSRGESELLPANRPIPEVIDHYVDLKLKETGIPPAPPADDCSLARRLYLDLAGRIPTAAEARAYSASTDPHKRQKLIDTLLAMPEFARHNATEFDGLLRNDNPNAPSLRPYLLTAFRENRSWDRMFRELLGVEPNPARPHQFVTGRLKDPDALTRDVSSVFFGLNISCAQCHRHPYIKALTQDYYFGLQSFFARSYEIQGNLLERQYAAPLTYKTKGGEARTASMLFLDGKTAVAPSYPGVDLNRAIQEEARRIGDFGKNYAKTKQLPPAPGFNARRELAGLALRPDSRELFARSLVNRLWYRFHGYGLVMQVDQMHRKNKPSHPELLDWLSRDLIEHGYDLRRLIRGLVSSRCYSRTSRWEPTEPPAAELFAVARIRPLTPMQWGVSHRLVSNPARLKPGTTEAEKLLELLETEATQTFGKLIEAPHADFQIGVQEPLRLSNDPAILKKTGEHLVPALLQIKDRKQQIEEAVWTVLSRPPTEGEHRLLPAYLEQRKDRPADALGHVVWALVNSPEFRFNR